ncbi:WD40 repeat domain-containing protein [Streptomyces sp. GbtcB6]|uniref:WD40 repeat domain-containing protein n=1 Tax=Streptomyces sp. GbtcB6 TaxID=2824751 RepID=UPI001C309A89|nr:WD40 repeat domain-containing protein [Streptomyces sp. GbtcB6]
MTPADGRPARDLGGPSLRSEESHLQIHASDRARVYEARRDMFVAERDLHVHYEDGVRERRRVVAGSVSDECPYPGLAAFGTDQAQWFFGRDALVAKLLVRLDACLAVGGALVVVAPSGAGKSSLLRAGLLAELVQGALPGSALWPRVWLTPTSHPMEELGSHLWEVMEVGSDGSPVLPPDRLRRALARGPAERRVMVVVDQLEELFTLCPDKHERHAFLDAVLGIAEPGPGGEPPPGLVVFGLRSDFYTHCAGHPGLLSAVERNQVMVGPLSRTGVREAILYPAHAVGLDIEPGLVQLLLRDLGATEDGTDDTAAYEIGRLPLLAHALRATWMRRAGHVLTVEGYEATGGIANSVTTEADRWFDRLDPPAQETAQSVFLRLVKFGDRGTKDTRRPVPFDDLLSHCARPDEAAQVVEKFTRGRLLTREHDTVTITHEVLLRAWPRLQQWLRDHRARYLARQRLEDAAAAWQEAGRDTGMLYRGGRLEEARALTAGDEEDGGGGGAGGGIGHLASEFLADSVRHWQRGRRIRQGVVACLSVLAVLVAVSAGIALKQSVTAERERNTAIVGEIRSKADQLRTADPSLAAQLDLVAHRMNPGEPTEVNLLGDQNMPLSTVLTGHEGQVNAVGFSPDGRVLASGDGAGVIRLWNTDPTGHPSELGKPLRAFGKPVWGAVFTPDGHFLAAAGEDGTIRLWDVRDLRHPVSLGDPVEAGGGMLFTLAVSPDGHTLATAGEDRRIRLFDITDPRHPKPLAKPLTAADGDYQVDSVAFSPNGKLLASGGADGTVRLWQVTDRRHPSAVGQVPDPLSTGPKSPAAASMVAFSPDSRTLAAAGQDQAAHVWDVTHPAKPVPLPSENAGSSASVNAVGFSPRGDIMAYGGDDNAVVLENVTSPKDLRTVAPTLMGHTGHVWALAFDPSGTRLATAGNDHNIRLWTIPGTMLTGHAGYVATTALSHDGQLLASGSADKTVRLWNVGDAAAPRLVSSSIRVRASYPYTVAFNPEGRVLAVSAGPDVQLWDVTEPARPTLLSSPPRHADDNFLSVAFTPDGKTLAGGNVDGTVALWNVADPSRPTLLGPPLDVGTAGQINRVAVSPDGRTLAAASADGQLRLWDIADPAYSKPLGPLLPVSEEGLSTIAFSPNSRILATSGSDAAIRLWDLADRARPKRQSQDLTGHTGTVDALAFSPDNGTLVSGGSDYKLRLWDVHDPTHARLYGEPMTSVADYIDALVFSPDGRHLFIGSGDKTVRILPLTPQAAIDYICRSTGNVLTRDLWSKYVTHHAYNPPCAHL